MRRWYIMSAIAACLAVTAWFLSGSTAQEPANQQQAKPQPSKFAKSRIDKVTIYPNNALVTREVEVPEGNGLIELVVAPMPANIVSATMYSEAAEGLRVLTTRYSTRQTFEDTSKARRPASSKKRRKTCR